MRKAVFEICIITSTFAPLLYMQAIEKIYPELSFPKNIVITMHQKPDGDAMGSSLALYNFLKPMGHTVQVIAPTNWPKFLDWLPGASEVWDYERKKEDSQKCLDNADWIFCLDFNVMSRTKLMTDPLTEAKATKILIDHHQQPQEEAFSYGVSNVAKSSTAEMIYDFIENAGYLNNINKDIAACLYTGILTDTGSFRHPGTSSHVHSIVSNLMQHGLDHTKVHQEVFDNGSETRLRFIGNALVNRMEVFYEYNTALIAIPASDITKYSINTGDTEGLVNYPLSIEGIKMAAIIIDRGELIKCSFRSKGDIDVNIFARKYFNGGGHKNAAGGQSTESFEKAVEDFKTAMKENRELLSTYNF